MLSDSDQSNHNDEPWAYIYLTPLKTGDKEKNEMVLASYIRGFDYNNYCDNPSFYKNKPLKYKPGLARRSRESVVHCARETKTALEEYIKSRDERGKRFSKPKLQEHLSFTGSTDVSVVGEQSDTSLIPEDAEPELPGNKVKRVKKDAKIQKAAKEQAKKRVNSGIIDEYVNAMKKNRLNDDYTSEEIIPTPNDHLDESAVSNSQLNEMQREHAAATRAYQMQIRNLRNEVDNLGKENQQLKITLEQKHNEEDGENDYISGGKPISAVFGFPF